MIVAGKFSIAKEFLFFLKQEKKWWLIPLAVVFLLLGLFIIFAESSALAPFLYPLFSIFSTAEEMESTEKK